MTRKFSETEKSVAEMIARETGQPLEQVNVAYAAQMEKLIAKKLRHYTLIKARRPEIDKLESELSDHIKRMIEQSGVSKSEATAIVVLGHLSLRRGLARMRRGRCKPPKPSNDPLMDKIVEDITRDGDA